ncbi:hypothetical protein FACS1894145_3610 [Bacteroidia bacterium]|nr:hypothetical protein FACS1894145_3610 [Bacteroidia bacterium]
MKNNVSINNSNFKISFKMKKFKFLAIAAIAAATVMTSCSNDDEAVNNPADGKLTFASQVTGDPQARATSGNTWDGTETVSVNVNGTVYPFSVTAAGVLTCATQYWNDYTSVDAFAWYPATYSYPADQSAGIQAADFIFADKVTGITRTNYAATKLTFKHKTAKVSVTLQAGTGAPDLTGATVKITGYTEVDAIDNTGTNPTGAITGKTPGWITPDATTNTALLLPVALSNQNIFEVTLANGQTYYYNSSYTFEGGKSYTFTITVNKTSLTVVSNTIEDWESPTSVPGTAN